MNNHHWREVVREFHDLPDSDQDLLLKDLYNFSDGTKLLIINKLIGQADFSQLIGKMESETIGKVGRRRTPDGRSVGSIISIAKKSRAPVEVMLELEQLAYRGFIDFLNKFGGGPDSYLNLVPRHFEAFLRLVKENLPKRRREIIFGEVRQYLLENDNMMTDCTDEIFEEVTGLKVR